MKVILLSDVANVGKKYDVVDVAPGFARNFLFVRGVAEAVTKATAKRVAILEKKREEEKVRQNALLEKAIDGVGKAVVTISGKANEEGHLYAGITKEVIAQELGRAIGVSMQPEYIKLDKALKEVGEFKVQVEWNGKEAEFTVKIEAEAETE